VLDKFAAVQMLDVHFPTTDGRTLILSRHTELTADQKLLVQQLKLDLLPQPPPRITAPENIVRSPANVSRSEDFHCAAVDFIGLFLPNWESWASSRPRRGAGLVLGLCAAAWELFARLIDKTARRADLRWAVRRPSQAYIGHQAERSEKPLARCARWARPRGAPRFLAPAKVTISGWAFLAICRSPLTPLDAKSSSCRAQITADIITARAGCRDPTKRHPAFAGYIKA